MENIVSAVGIGWAIRDNSLDGSIHSLSWPKADEPPVHSLSAFFRHPPELLAGSAVKNAR